MAFFKKKKWNKKLLAAAEDGQLIDVKRYIKKGANLECRGKDGNTPLLTACRYGHLDVVRCLFEHGSDREGTNSRKFTPLIYATCFNHLEIVRYLVNVGCDIEATNEIGMSSLLFAASNGYLGIVQFLLPLWVDKEARAKKGSGALINSAAYGKLSVTRWLIEEEGISPYPEGRTPYDMAAAKYERDSPEMKRNKEKVANFLKSIMSGQDQDVTQGILQQTLTDSTDEIQIFTDKEFKDLLKSGAYKCYWNRIYLTGPFGVGKTALAKILVGDEVPDKREATDGIWIYIGRAGMDIQERRWIFLEKGTILNATVQSLLRSTEMKDSGTVSLGQKMTDSVAENSSEEMIDSGKSYSNKKTSNDGSASDDNLIAMDMSEDDLVKFLRSECNKGNYEMVIVPIDLWDFGGQKIYQITHQLFISSRGTFLLVFNGSKGIYEDIPDYTELPGCQGQRNTAVYIIHWVNSVLTYCKTLTKNEEYPKIVCVATHKDQVKGDIDEQRNLLEISIEKLFENHGGKQHLQYKPLIFVDARNKEDDEIDNLKKQLVEIALNHPRCGELMPTKFVPLELQLAKQVGKKTKILSMDELNDLNKQNKKSALTPDQLTKFLKVNHALGKLIYFDEAGLRDNVIIDPVFLVDVLRSIVTDEQFWPDHLLDMLRDLKANGKLLKQDLYEIWKHDRFREISVHTDYMVKMLAHLDIICRQKDEEDGSEYFLVPCMISTKREDNQNIDLDRSTHLAYRFKEEVVPPAILYRFIASFISMWKLRVSAKSGRLMIFTDSADVTIDNEHDMRFDIRENRFIVSLSHKENQMSIVPTIASTAQECLTHALTNISNFYFSVSEDSDCTRDVPFTIQIGIACGTGLCFLDHTMLSKEGWKCPHHNRKHKTNIVARWFADKIHTKDDRCPDDCLGLDKAWLDNKPDDRHLGRLAAELTIEETRKLYIHLKEKNPARSWEKIKESNNKLSFDLKINALYDWRKSTPYASFKQLWQSLKDEEIDIHKLCQILREVQRKLDQPRETLISKPSSSFLNLLPDHIGNQTFQLGIELGLSVVEMQKIERNHVTNLHRQTEEVLRIWRSREKATYDVLVKAFDRLELSGVLSYLACDIGLEEPVDVRSEEPVLLGIDEQVIERIIEDIQISQILDYMMSHLVMSSDDRRRIEQHAGQDDQNKALLILVQKRGAFTYTVFADALRTYGNTDLVIKLKYDQEEGSDSALGNVENKGLSDWNIPVYKVRLQKNYSNIVDNIQHEKIVDHLISRGVLTIADSQMIYACPAQIQQNRKLIDILLHSSENGFFEFLNALREDSVYAELADEIENTTVSSRDISTYRSCFK